VAAECGHANVAADGFSVSVNGLVGTGWEPASNANPTCTATDAVIATVTTTPRTMKKRTASGSTGEAQPERRDVAVRRAPDVLARVGVRDRRDMGDDRDVAAHRRRGGRGGQVHALKPRDPIGAVAPRAARRAGLSPAFRR